MLWTLLTLLSVGFALAANTVTRPATNEVIQADGGSYGIQWTPDSADSVVSIALINGSTPVSTIASQIQNTGIFVWIVPRSLTAGTYTIAIAGGASGQTPTDFTSSGPFIVTGPSALSSSVASLSVASSMSSMASSLEAQLSSIFQAQNSSASGNMTAAANSTMSNTTMSSGSSASAMSGSGSGSTTATGSGGATSSGGGGAIVGPSATAARTGNTIGASTPSSSASATGTSGTEPLVRHADFAVIIFAVVCVLMQI